jgi:hypothetical protein
MNRKDYEKELRKRPRRASTVSLNRSRRRSKLPPQFRERELEIADQRFCAREVCLSGRFSLSLTAGGALGTDRVGDAHQVTIGIAY